ncbi:MAG: hypothetical protein U0271_43550 [Polyangiaceae bacterium]
MRLTVGTTLAIALFAACEGGGAKGTNAPVSTQPSSRGEASTSAAPPSQGPPRGGPEVVYEAPSGGQQSTRLFAVDTTAKRAFLSREAREPKRAYRIDTVDYESGKLVESWIASDAGSEHWAGSRSLLQFAPLDGEFATDLARFAKLAELSGRGVTRPGPLSALRAGATTVYGSEDRAWLATTTQPKRLSAPWPATLSPDGQRLAYPKEYASTSVCVTPIADNKPVCTTSSDGSVAALFWSRDATTIYSIVRKGLTDQCLVAIADKGVGAPREVKCAPLGEGIAFAQSPSGGSGLLLTKTSATWVALPSFEAKGAIDGLALPTAPLLEELVVDDSGRFAILTDGGGSLVFGDVASKRTAKRLPEVYFEGIRATQFVGDGVLLLLERRKNGADALLRVALEP